MEGITNTTEKQERIKRFQEKHTPPALRSQKKVNMLIAAGLEHMYQKEATIEGLENLPEDGPFIVIGNHFNVKETEILLATLKNFDTHVVAAEKVHGEHPVRKIGLGAIRGITAPESLANLSEEEKQSLMGRVSDTFVKEKYQEIIDAEEAGEVDKTGLMQFVRSSAALLSRGDVLVMYPEGLWLYDGENESPRSQTLYKGYSGFDVVAKQYKKLTGENIPIIPIATFIDDDGNKQVKIDQRVDFSSMEEDVSSTDFCMSKIADMLPEEQRGYYASTNT
ncbi:MAG: 1-acyl-sn-glycerol-3-phosphate acyltransferase [Patiriisocius sp.]|jgi:1-acyl-sn-glycerol-3-phosphate acyltransferase